MKTFKQYITEQEDVDERGHRIPTVGKPRWNRISGHPRDHAKDIIDIDTPFGKAKVHRDAASAYTGLFNDLHASGAPIKKLGSYGVRPKRSAGPGHSPGGGWSQHSYGNAVDIDDKTQLTPEFQKWRKENPGKFSSLKTKWGMLTPKGDEPHLEYGGNVSQQAHDEIRERVRKAKEGTKSSSDSPVPGPEKPIEQPKPQIQPKTFTPNVADYEKPGSTALKPQIPEPITKPAQPAAETPQAQPKPQAPEQKPDESKKRWADVRAAAGYSARQSVTSDPELLNLYNKWKEGSGSASAVNESIERFVRRKYNK